MAVERNGEAGAAQEEEASCSIPKSTLVANEEIRAVAQKFADQAVQNPDPGVWAVLTAISKNARQRPQGMNILLSSDEHCLGRCVEDSRFQISSVAISANHCRLFRDKAAFELGLDLTIPVFLRDTSTNGTYVNWTRLRKSSPPTRLHHGDIIAFVAPPHDDNSYAFVYREVNGTNFSGNRTTILKRKPEEIIAESKKLKGIGIGSPDGPISLDDVRSLQRSNSELRQQLESHVLTIESLSNKGRASITQHENEMKELKENIARPYLDQIKDLQHLLDEKQKETDSLNAATTDLHSCIKDLNERLSASKQSCADADEIIQSQKATISELETQLNEERNMRREEREKAVTELKSAVEKVQAEAQEEIKRHSVVYQRQHKEQQEVISKLQESEKESRVLVETLRSKLEDIRESLVMSEKKVRQLEAQVQDEHLATANCKKKSEALESDLRKLKNELENEKVAREDAWAKVSTLELEIAAAIRDLSIEKQRFQEARERIILRETQLRAFYSTTEEISALFSKQQEQLKAMQKTLEDEEKYEYALTGIDLNQTSPRNTRTGNEEPYANANARETSPNNNAGSASHNSSTEKDASQDGNTQDLECTSVDKSAKGFGSDIDAGAGPVDTERVIETESQAGDAAKCGNLGGETMQLDDEPQPQENTEPKGNGSGGSQTRLEDTEPGTILTADLLASEVAGSWAVSTAPSVNGENESPVDNANVNITATATAAAADALLCLGSEASGSQSNNGFMGFGKLTEEHRMLNAMIEIVDPEFRKKLPNCSGNGNANDISDAETEEGGSGSKYGGADDEDTDAQSHGDGGGNGEDDNDAMIEDSVG